MLAVVSVTVLATIDGITTQEKAQASMYRRRWWMLAVVSVTVLLATIDETILSVAIPSLQRDLGASAGVRRCSGCSARTCWSSVACS